MVASGRQDLVLAWFELQHAGPPLYTPGGGPGRNGNLPDQTQITDKFAHRISNLPLFVVPEAEVECTTAALFYLIRPLHAPSGFARAKMFLKHGEFAEVHRFIGPSVPTALQNEERFLAGQSLGAEGRHYGWNPSWTMCPIESLCKSVVVPRISCAH
jgi:hypothetical protein